MLTPNTDRHLTSTGFRQSRRVGIGAFAIAAAVIMAACGANSNDTPAIGTTTLTDIKLRVGVLTVTSRANQLIRIESKAFDDTPYRIEWAEFISSNNALESLNAGAIDVAVDLQSTATVLTQGNAKTPWTRESSPFLVIGAKEPLDSPGLAVAVQADSDIESVADLRGKKVAYSKGSLNQYYWALLAKQAGFGPGDVEEVQLPTSEGRAAFAAGAVDALMSANRNLTQLVESGDARVIAVSGDLVPQLSFVLVRPGVLDDPQVEAAVADLLDRLDRSETWEASNPELTSKIYERENQLDAELAALYAREGAGVRLPVGGTLTAALQDQADVFYDVGVIANKIDVSILIDDRFDQGAG